MIPVPGVGGKDSLQAPVALFRSISNNHHAGMLRIADAHTTPVMNGNPGSARSGVDQGVEEWPVGNRVGSVSHALCLPVGRCHGTGVEVIPSDHDRSLQFTRTQRHESMLRK